MDAKLTYLEIAILNSDKIYETSGIAEYMKYVMKLYLEEN